MPLGQANRVTPSGSAGGGAPADELQPLSGRDFDTPRLCFRLFRDRDFQQPVSISGLYVVRIDSIRQDKPPMEVPIATLATVVHHLFAVCFGQSVAFTADGQDTVVECDFDIVWIDTGDVNVELETEKNTTISTKANQLFSTAEDNQAAVTVHMLQGERDKASGNKSLAQFNLENIPPAPRGQAQIEVTFDIDANGILNVAAKDNATGKEQSIVIKASSGLSEADVERMVHEAEARAAQDRQFRELVEVRNRADQMIHEARKALDSCGDHIDEGLKSETQEAAASL